MIKGITQKENLIIKEILKNYSGKFYAYGSRVKGDFTPLSDLDVLVECEDFDKIVPELKEKFDNSLLPYIVNFTNKNSINENFYNQIKNDLTDLFQ